MKTLLIILCIIFFLVGNIVAEIDFFKNSKGEVLNYKTSITKKNEQKLKKIGTSGNKYQFIRSMPLDIEIKFSGIKEHKNKPCYLLDHKSKVTNPMFGKFPGQPETAIEYKKSYISKEGQIMYIKTITKAGGNTNTNKEWDLPFHATLNFFYGQWMLKLKNNYIYKVNNDQNQIEIKVIDIKEKDGKKYFVVKYLIMKNNKVHQDLIYWVDQTKRIAVFVKDQYSEMRSVRS